MNKQYRLEGCNFVVAAPFGRTSDCSLAAFARVVAQKAASRGHIVPSGKGWRRTSTVQSAHCCKGLLGGGVLAQGVFEIFRWEALEVSTRPQAHCQCTTPRIQDLVSHGLRCARTLVLAPRATSNEHVFCFSRTPTLLLCRLRVVVAREAQPVCQCLGIGRKQKKKQGVSSVSVPVPTQKRRKSQALEQVIQVSQSSDSLEDPEPPRKAATKRLQCTACNKVSAVRLARAGQSAVRDGRWFRQSLPVLL